MDTTARNQVGKIKLKDIHNWLMKPFHYSTVKYCGNVQSRRDCKHLMVCFPRFQLWGNIVSSKIFGNFPSTLTLLL